MKTLARPEILETLGTALREARTGSGLTLEDLADSMAGPRTWSQSHLSKVERAKEIPSGELIHFYERETEVPPGSLITLWEAMTGERYIPSEEARARTLDWIVERIEMDLDLRGPEAILIETRDLVANKAGLSDYWSIYDPDTDEDDLERSGFSVDLGGVAGAKVRVDGTRLVRSQVRFGRELGLGEYARVRFAHTFDRKSFPPFLNFTTLSERTREAIVTVRFSRTTTVSAFSDVLAEYVQAAIAGTDEVLCERLGLRSIPLALDNSSTWRFSYPRPGMYSGLTWGTIGAAPTARRTAATR